MPKRDDYSRYIEKLQNDLLTPGWETVFDSESWAEWVAKNSSRLRESSAGTFGSGQDPVQHLERLTRDFQPGTRFELHLTNDIFGPLFEEVKLGARAIGLEPIREVHITTSTCISATPVAMPTSGAHELFIGLGTSSFCNYWAKAFTALVRTTTRFRPYERIENTEDLRTIFRNDSSSLLLATRLALMYAIYGTLLGFGEVQQPPDYQPYRLELLRAMETFAVAHEYSHFVAEEQLPELRGVDLEFFCDELGLQISRKCSNQGDSWLGFCGVGPLIFFRSVQLCEIVRNQLVKGASLSASLSPSGEKAHAHPPLEDRVLAIRSQLLDKTVDDQRAATQQFVEEYDRFATGLAVLVSENVELVLKDGRLGQNAIL